MLLASRRWWGIAGVLILLRGQRRDKLNDSAAHLWVANPQEGAIELQGDLRDRVRDCLTRKGIVVKG